MKLTAALSVAALCSGSASAGPVEPRTRVPVKGIVCNIGGIDWAFFEEAQIALNRLRTENPSYWRKIAPGPGKCEMRTSYGRAQIYICNDNRYEQPVSNIDAYEIGWEAFKKCSPKSDSGYFNGQGFTEHNWNVIVRGS